MLAFEAVTFSVLPPGAADRFFDDLGKQRGQFMPSPFHSHSDTCLGSRPWTSTSKVPGGRFKHSIQLIVGTTNLGEAAQPSLDKSV